MPELPEVETIRIGAKEKLIGKKITDVEVRVPKIFRGDKKNIIGTKVTDVKRIAKVLEIVLDNGYSVLIHLKMTGQLVFQSKGEKVIAKGGHFQRAYADPMPHKHTHIIYTFSDGSKLYFNDLRKFGWNIILRKDEAERFLGKDSFGPEPFSKDFNSSYLKDKFKKTHRSVKEVLIDQKIISGIGNIYSNDALYWAGILPTRKASNLSDEEINKLTKSIEKVFNLGLKYGGSSENTYVNIEGKKGKYMDYTATYQQKKDPKGHPLKRIKIGGRSAFYCPICQK